MCRSDDEKRIQAITEKASRLMDTLRAKAAKQRTHGQVLRRADEACWHTVIVYIVMAYAVIACIVMV